ncbi:hypothetical protein AAFF_G00153320 [Aldrovandia affinis]|uniref:Uncharacterized protein n=1 Tax=Aldrovandia affinis TaxID=143900 RepID=A0AAD7SZL6_9TELE|nr:hypothetical protein AAFF_G00153320 [Aldrovandia affinis]
MSSRVRWRLGLMWRGCRSVSQPLASRGCGFSSRAQLHSAFTGRDTQSRLSLQTVPRVPLYRYLGSCTLCGLTGDTGEVSVTVLRDGVQLGKRPNALVDDFHRKRFGRRIGLGRYAQNDPVYPDPE